MCIWDYDSSDLLYEFLGHKNRILSLIKPQNSSLVFTASADETLKIWDLTQYLKPLSKKQSDL